MEATTFGDFRRVMTGRGLEVFVHGTEKFKSNVIRILYRGPLGDKAPARALLPNLLRRGSQQHPTMVEVARALEDLYGASWSASTYRLGDEQVLSFRLEFVESRFLPGAPELVQPALELAREFLCAPVLDGNGLFPEEMFRQEQLNLRREVEAQFNDKHSHALQRLQEEMFPGDPYGRPLLGTVEEVDALTPQDATAAWSSLREELGARVLAVGTLSQDELAAWTESSLPGRPVVERALPGDTPLAPAAGRHVIEQEDISQSKLCLGYRVDLQDLGERAFDALRIYSSILGGGFHSRLFQTIREKHSLAYYASSSLDRLKGVLYVTCGIDAGHREQVLELTGAEMESLQGQPPTTDEFQQSLRLAMSSTRSVADSASALVDVLDAGLSCRRPRGLAQIVASLEQVTPEDVCRAARRVGPLEVAYCLEGANRHGG